MADVKNSIAETKKKEKTVFEVIQAGKDQFAAALPKHINSDRFTRIAITILRQNPKLQECNVPSLLGCLMTLAQLGLEPGVLGQAYLIPFNNKKLNTVECQLQISYKGLIELLRRTGQLRDIYGYPVFENDTFELKYGLHRDLIHMPLVNGDRGSVKGFYTVAILKDGTTAFEYMTATEVNKHEEKYRLGQFKNSIWVKNYDEMAIKTVAKKMLKWLPLSVDILEKLDNDDKSFKYLENTGETEMKEIDKEEFELLPEANQETGEIVEAPKQIENGNTPINENNVANIF